MISDIEASEVTDDVVKDVDMRADEAFAVDGVLDR